MPTLRASVLIIGHPDPLSIAFGANFAADFDQARNSVNDFSYPVIVLPSTSESSDEALRFLKHLSGVSPLSQRVIIQNDTQAEPLRDMINSGSVFRILPSFADKNFDLTIQEALEEYRLLQQNAKLLQLVNEQNERLKRLSGELEDRVEARRKSLEDAKEKLVATNQRVEALHRALVAIHRAGSIAEMERLINEALSVALGLSWTRVLFQSQAQLDVAGSMSRRLVSLHRAPLMRGKETLGHIYFARGAEAPFTRDENSFLGQIADAVSLAIDRLTKLEQAEALKHQWEATFDAIPEPVSLIDSDHTVLRINRSFAQRAGASPDTIIGRRCHEVLFGRAAPCEGCDLGGVSGHNFRLKPARTAGGADVIYDVFSQSIRLKPDDRSLHVNVYYDVSSQLRYERQILESSKMAELGTIGSSIAHELNNPLGGMLSFLQLVKMDLKGDESWYDDIIEMERGARRCRDIVQNLLGFTRKSSHDTVDPIDLREVVEQALKITELQTRAMGITIENSSPMESATVKGQFNALAQAVRSILQLSQEAVAARMRAESRFSGRIRIRLEAEGGFWLLDISDNSSGFDMDCDERAFDSLYVNSNTSQDPLNTASLGLSVARQILRDHGGELRLRSTKGTGNSAKISLPRLVFDS